LAAATNTSKVHDATWRIQDAVCGIASITRQTEDGAKSIAKMIWKIANIIRAIANIICAVLDPIRAFASIRWLSKTTQINLNLAISAKMVAADADQPQHYCLCRKLLIAPNVERRLVMNAPRTRQTLKPLRAVITVTAN
jgi:hypothetical protein